MHRQNGRSNYAQVTINSTFFQFLIQSSFFVKNTILALFVFLAAGTSLLAQQDVMISHLPNQWQFNHINPASFPTEQRFVIALPGLSIDGGHSGGINLSDFYKRENNRNLLDFSGLINKLESLNYLSYRQSIETAGLGFRLGGKGKTAFTVGHAIRLQADAFYFRELPELLWSGNAAFIGETIEIAPRVTAFDWHELQVGVSRSLGPVRLGVKVKRLMGVSALQTDPTAQSATVYTDTDIYQLSLRTDFGIYSSGIISAIDTAGLGFKVIANEFQNRPQSTNGGWATDWGVQLKVNDRLQLFASALDVRSTIRWKEADYYYSKGDYDYEGAVIPGTDLINGVEGLDFNGKLDTLNDLFGFKRYTADDFKSTISGRYYLGGQYQFSERWRLSASFFHENRAYRSISAGGVSAHYRPLKWMEIGALFSFNEATGNRLGAQWSLQPKFARFFIATDDIAGLIDPLQTSRVQLRTGMALCF